MKIASLLPAATEIVRHLGRGDDLIAVSHSCKQAGALPVLTRSRVPLDLSAAETDARVRELLAAGEALFELDEAALIALQPDVVLSQSLCNVCAIDASQIERAIHRLGGKTKLIEWSPTRLDDVIGGIELIGSAINAAAEARAAAGAMRRALQPVEIAERPTVVFLEWLSPLFCAGHWIPELVHLAGGHELIGQSGGRSRTITPADVIAADPDVLIACCCGWSAERTQAELATLESQPWWQSLRAVQQGRVFVVDAETDFTTPGPGLVRAVKLLAQHFDVVGNSCGERLAEIS